LADIDQILGPEAFHLVKRICEPSGEMAGRVSRVLPPVSCVNRLPSVERAARHARPPPVVTKDRPDDPIGR